jgi:hypothetical protein
MGYLSIQAMEKCQFEEHLIKFATCSSDRTIRFWHHIDSGAPPAKQLEINKCLSRNAYCKDMSKMIFIQRQVDDTAAATNFDHFKAKPLDRDENGDLITAEKDDHISS